MKVRVVLAEEVAALQKMFAALQESGDLIVQLPIAIAAVNRIGLRMREAADAVTKNGDFRPLMAVLRDLEPAAAALAEVAYKFHDSIRRALGRERQ